MDALEKLGESAAFLCGSAIGMFCGKRNSVKQGTRVTRTVKEVYDAKRGEIVILRSVSRVDHVSR